MDLLWAVLIGLVVFLLYAAMQLLRALRRPAGARARDSVTADPVKRRPVRWISMQDCTAIFASEEKPVFVDLRPPVRRRPLPLSIRDCVPAASVLTACPADLPEILAWLPPSRSVIIYGASGLCAAMIQTSPGTCKDAFVYLIAEDPRSPVTQVSQEAR